MAKSNQKCSFCGKSKDEVKRLSKQLAPYKRPINITITDQALPRTATRKVQRRHVKELVLK